MIFGSLILFLMGRRRWRVLKDVAEYWNLFLPAFAAVGMYSIINVDYRYVGPFLPLIWLGIFSGIRLPDSEESKKLLRYVAIVMTLVLMMVTIHHLIKDGRPLSHVQWQVADTLNHMGIKPGDKVASIGYSHSHFWARLARVHIVAEMPQEEVDSFWRADGLIKARVYETFRKTGAKAVITNLLPDNFSPPGWKRLADTDYYVYTMN